MASKQVIRFVTKAHRRAYCDEQLRRMFAASQSAYREACTRMMLTSVALALGGFSLWALVQAAPR